MGRHEFVVDQVVRKGALVGLVFETLVDEADSLVGDLSASWVAVVSFAEHVHQLREGLRVEGRLFSEESVYETPECPHIHINTELLIVQNLRSHVKGSAHGRCRQ